MGRKQITLTQGDKFWSCSIDDQELVLETGKTGGKARQRRVPPKTAAGKQSIEWELMSLAWKEFKRGFRYDAADASELRWLVHTPDGMGVEPGEAALTEDGSTLLVCQHSDGKGSRIHRIDLESGESSLLLRDPGFVLRGVRALPGGGALFAPEATGGDWATSLIAPDGEVQVLLTCRIGMLGCLMAATADGRRVVGVDGSDVVVLDGSARKEIYRRAIPKAQHSQGHGLALSPDGQSLLLGLPREGQTAELVFVDLERGEEQTHQAGVDACFDSMVWVDGGYVVLERFQKPRVWTAAGVQRELQCDWAGSLASSPNGRYLGAYQSGKIAVYDHESGEPVFEAEERLHHRGGALLIGADGLLVTTGGGLIGRWDTKLATS